MTTNNKVWRMPKPNPTLQEIFSMKLGISKIIAQLLINRGINTLEEARLFLYGGTDFYHDPFTMKDMDKAVDRISLAINNGEKIRVFGDYDVDGITSTAILVKVLSFLGGTVDYHIPERLTEGYGMNRMAVSAAAEDGVSLIITVDSGISSRDEVIFANTMGIDVIVTDHHEPPLDLPPALAVINPKQERCPYPFKDLAGAGVAFKLGQALLDNMDSAIFNSLTELACLGTIADIVPLKGENRIIAKKGLECIERTGSVGLRELMDQCGVDRYNVGSRQVAFQIAPKINAAGRLGNAAVGVKLLLSDNEEESRELAAHLCTVNEERQAVESAIYKEAVEFIESGGLDLDRDKVIVLAREGWHQGVIGIVASKLVQDYYRPVVLLCIEGDSAKGSARSIPNFNIYEAFKNNELYLEKYGGHRQAAGLTIPVINIPSFSKGLNKYADEVLTADDLCPEVYIDSEVSLSDLDDNLYRQLQLLAPYGCENPGPVMSCRGADIIDHRTVGAGGNHLKLRIRDNRFVFDAIGFNLGEQKDIIASHDQFDIIFSLEKNEWNGRTTMQLNIKDFRPAVLDGGLGLSGDTKEEGFVEQLFANALTYLTDDFYRDIADKEEFYTKVVGVTFDNRQEAVSRLYEGEKLDLVREPDNTHDSNAVRVVTNKSVQLGYLNARLARHFAPLLDRGDEYVTYVSQVTGGNEKNYGLNIVIQKVREECRAEYRQRMAGIREDLAALSDRELADRIREALLGSNSYREKQLEAMEMLLDGHNTLSIFGTGRGKSVVFQSVAAFKALKNRELTVILYPLRALVNDQFENMSAKVESLGLRLFRGNGSISTIERAMLFDAIENEDIDILLTTPEFISHHMRKIQSMNKKVGLFVVDESHHIGLSSQSHRPIYKRLGEISDSLGSPPVLAVTATAGEAVADEIIETLKITRVVVDPHIRTNLQLVDKRDWPDKNSYLKKLVSSGAKIIIYVNSRLQTVELAAMLRESLPEISSRIIFYHAGLNSEHRNAIESMFRRGEVSTVVSTSAFGEGIDIPDVKHIVVYHLNFSLTEFNQQCGRCGRDGEDAQIHLVCGKRDAAINEFILESSSPDRDTLAKLYIVLKELAAKSHPISVSNDDIAKMLKAAGIRYARPNLVSAGLGILEELELVQRESAGRDRQIYLLPAPGEKVGIDQSLRFVEGEEEKKAFKEFQDYFFKASGQELLDFINRPIYPAKYVTAEKVSSPTG